MADMAESGSGSKLFVRQSSGLVRNVSVTNALFFNVAAFVGVGLTLYTAFLHARLRAGVAFAGLSEYGWAAIISGVFFIFLSLIFASLDLGDATLGRRLRLHEPHRPSVPRAGWSGWTLVLASVAIIAFEIPLVLRNLQITARIIGIGAGGHFFKDANTWFTDSSGVITGIAGLHRLAGRAGADRGFIVLLPTRSFHRFVTALAAIGVAGFVLMFIFGLLATSGSDFQHNLPQYTGGVTGHEDRQRRRRRRILPGATHSFLSDLFSRTVFPFMLGHRVPEVHRLPVLGVHLGRGARQRQARRDDRASRRAGDRRVRELDLRRPPDPALRLRHQHRRGAHLLGRHRPRALPMGQPNSLPLLATVAKHEPVAGVGVHQLRRDRVPVPAVPRVHQLHQPDRPRMEPRPAAARVVRRGERADAGAAERDPGDAGPDGDLPAAPELLDPAQLDRSAGRQAEPGRDALVQHLHGGADLDHAGGERAPRGLAEAGPDPQRAVPPGAAVARARLARLPAVDLRLGRREADLGEPHRHGNGQARLPEQHGHHRHADRDRDRRRDLHRHGAAEPARRASTRRCSSPRSRPTNACASTSRATSTRPRRRGGSS